MFNVLKKIFKLSNKIRIGFFNLIFWVVVIIIAVSIQMGSGSAPTGETLLIQPLGSIMEEPGDSDLLSLLSAVDGEIPEDTLLRDILASIELAIADEDILDIILDLDYMHSAGFATTQEIGGALKRFRDSGRKIYAFSSFYNQEHYYIASFADEIVLDPFGEISLNGIGVYRNYWKESLDRFDVDVQIFRAGEFKSYVEPYMSTSMSDGVKKQNLLWMDSIWNSFLDTIDNNRPFKDGVLNLFTQKRLELIQKYNGNSSFLALEEGFVDRLETSDEFYSSFGNLYHFSDYLINNQPFILKDKIAVVTLEGTITYSNEGNNSINASSVIDLLDSVLMDEEIQGLIVRINSGGGGVFASEAIRRKVTEVKENMPVVISMGDVCASGGYWIATAGDRILANPNTITGSIGVFGMIFGLQETLEKHLGVYNDGVSTTPFGGQGDITRNISRDNAAIYQLSVEDFYNKFLTLVHESRDIDLDKLETIAGGRVWSGRQASEVGLVDEVGGINEAKMFLVNELDNENLELIYLEEELSMFEQIMTTFLSEVTIPSSLLNRVLNNQVVEELNIFETIDDPKNVYALWY